MTLANRLRELGLDPKLDQPMAKIGFWRLGGPADVFVKVPSVALLREILGIGPPVTIIGNGSNMLVSDAGIRGITVRLVGEFFHSEISIEGESARVVAGGGVLNAVLLRRIDKAGLTGLACLAGVPGTLGGAIRMNAGTSLGQIADRELHAVELCLPDGEIRTLLRDAIDFSYRWADLPPGAIVTRAWLRLDAEASPEVREAIGLHLSRRMTTQPLDQPSCGSVFKNPPGDYAGRLIEAVGLKGVHEGGARISPKHANFIVNTGNSTALDVVRLMRRARAEVWQNFRILLEPEVHAVGEWSDGEWPLPHPESET